MIVAQEWASKVGAVAYLLAIRSRGKAGANPTCLIGGCHTYPRHSFTCCTHSKHGSEPADKRARRFLETQDLGRENSRPARRADVALPGAD